MIELGEKIKQLREEKGLTQQTLAEQLYVTRQAVSRWECGARFPDLLTAKKIAQILDTTIDDLVSGEKLEENIERKPLLAMTIENIIQTILYTTATIAYMLMCIFSLYSFLFPSKGLVNTPAGKITFLSVSTLIGYMICFAAALAGLILSSRNKLKAKMTGYITCVPYMIAAISFVVVFLDMLINQNGHLGITEWITDFMIPVIFAVLIVVFFKTENRRIPFSVIGMICFVSIGYIVLVLNNSFTRATDLGFVVRTVHCIGKVGMIFLLGYQAYVWDAKKKIAYKGSDNKKENQHDVKAF